MKKNILFAIPFILAACCIVAFNLIGSTVNSEGFLIEPFFLIPFACIFFLVGVISLVVRGFFCILRLIRR